MIYNMVSQGGATPTGTKTINITANGTTTEDVTNYANAQVVANVPNTYAAGDEGKVVLSGALVSQTTRNVTANGTYDTTTNNSTIVAVPASAVDTGTKNITANGNNQDVVGFAAVNVNVPNTYSAGDEGKVVSSGALVSQTSATYTANATYDTTLINSVTVNVDDAPTLQNKTESYTPTESVQTDTITASPGYDGLASVGVTIGAISDTYVGSAIDRRDSTDLSASGATVTAPAGYYASSASTTIASGSATTPSTTITANPSISVSAGGLITATASASQSVTPTVSPGYVSTGTAGTVSVSGSNTQQLSTQGATTITPTTSSQTAVAAGKYTTGAVTVAAMPTGTAGTPTATKSAVNNHSLTVTPSVTNTTGYITGGTLTGTAVTVTAAELESGTKTITANGSGIDVSGYSMVDVNVSGGGGGVVSIVDTVDPVCGGTIRTITTNSLTLDTLNATSNGTYTAPSGHAYDEVNVSVSGGCDPEDFAKGLVPSGDITLTGNQPVSVSYGISGRKNITSIYLPDATSLSSNPYAIYNNTGSFTIYAPSLTGVSNYGISSNSGLTAVCLPSLSGAMNANNLRGNAYMTVADIGSTTNLTTTCMYGCSSLTTLILRKSDAITTLGNTNALQNTPFYTGGTGGTIYIPQVLYNHLGDGTALDYQAATNWSTLYSAGTITWVKIEGSIYASTSWIVD